MSHSVPTECVCGNYPTKNQTDNRVCLQLVCFGRKSPRPGGQNNRKQEHLMTYYRPEFVPGNDNFTYIIWHSWTNLSTWTNFCYSAAQGANQDKVQPSETKQNKKKAIHLYLTGRGQTDVKKTVIKSSFIIYSPRRDEKRKQKSCWWRSCTKAPEEFLNWSCGEAQEWTQTVRIQIVIEDDVLIFGVFYNVEKVVFVK